MRFLRRALEEEAPAALRREVLLDLGAAESAARMPDAASRMEQALELSCDPTERAHAALGLSMVRFLAGELPGAIAACEDLLMTADGLDRELLLALEFQAAATRLVGGLPSAETFGRLLALEAEVSRGETAAERSLLAMIAVVFAGTTARTADEVAALAEAAWGDGRLLVEVRSEHPALAAPATSIALTAATIAIALTGRLTRAIEVWTAGRRGGTGAELDDPLLQLARPARLRAGLERRPERRRDRRGRGAGAASRRRPDRPARPRSPRSPTCISSAARTSGPSRSCGTRGRRASCR